MLVVLVVFDVLVEVVCYVFLRLLVFEVLVEFDVDDFVGGEEVVVDVFFEVVCVDGIVEVC